MQLSKNIKIFLNYVLGPLLFVWLAFSIYGQVKAQPGLGDSWKEMVSSFGPRKLLFLILLVLLMFVNWGLESLKWRLAVFFIHPVNFLQAFRAVLSGVAFSITIPNRVGEYLGRILYLPEGKRLKTISATMVASLSQVLVTLVAGLLGMLVLRNKLVGAGPLSETGYRLGTTIVGFLILILTLFYFNVSLIERLLEKWLKPGKWTYLIEAIRLFSMQRLTHLLLLSVARYLVFIVQYFLAFRLFGVDVSLPELGWVMTVIFLALSMIPTIVLTELGVRGAVTLTVMGLFSSNSLGILLTTISIWFINLVLPALAGSLFILGIKLFRQRNEEQ